MSGDFENCFADDPAGVGETVSLAREAGLAGCSVEDWSGSEIYDVGLAAERVAAAAEAAHAGPAHLVLTARAENHVHGRHDLNDTIERLLSYQEAGADVLFAPRLRGIEQVRSVLQAIDVPLNVLVWTGGAADQRARRGRGEPRLGGQFLRLRRLRRARRGRP